jgi:hypothetical protein
MLADHSFSMPAEYTVLVEQHEATFGKTFSE